MELNTAESQVSKPITSSLWSFAEELYGKPGIEEQCLHLQNHYHANIPIVLWCCWLKEKGIVLPASYLDEALMRVDAISHLTLTHLRHVRRHLKESSGFSLTQSGLIKKQILSAELLIEKALIERLNELTEIWLDDDLISSSAPEASLSLSHYLEFIRVPNFEDFVGILEMRDNV